MDGLILVMTVYVLLVIAMAIAALVYVRNACCLECLNGAVRKPRQEEDTEDPPPEDPIYCPNGCPGACACPTLDNWDILGQHSGDLAESAPNDIMQSREYEEYKIKRQRRRLRWERYAMKRAPGEDESSDSSTDDEYDDACDDSCARSKLLHQNFRRMSSEDDQIQVSLLLESSDEDQEKVSGWH